MLVLDGFLDALRRRGVAVLAALESRRASLSDSVSAFAVSLSGSALHSSEEPSHRLTSHRIGLARLHRLNYTFIIT